MEKKVETSFFFPVSDRFPIFNCMAGVVGPPSFKIKIKERFPPLNGFFPHRYFLI